MILIIVNMRRMAVVLVGLVLTVVTFGAVYIVPPDWFGLQNSVRSSNVIILFSGSSDGFRINGISVKGQLIDVEYACTRVAKIQCGGVGRPRIYGQITSYILLNSLTKEPVSAAGFDLKAVDYGNYFLVCGVGAGADGRIYIARNCYVTTGDVSDFCDTGSDSYIWVNVYQVCLP